MKIPLTFAKIAIATSLIGASLTGWYNAALAGDPFRTTNPRNIGDKTEAAFNALFKEGNYPQAKQYLNEATKTEANEPLSHAMRASLAYTEKDWDGLKLYADKTLDAATKLQSTDPVRGNLYLAVGSFLEGAYVFEKEGPVSALNKLQKVFEYLDTAEKAAPNDPEVNLVKGYCDLMLAVNLPFASAEDAIQRLDDYAKPEDLADRGIAMGYRDLKQYDKALEFINKTLAANPDNPELQYLKGQILRSKGKKDKNVTLLKEALNYYNLAFQKENQLPETTLKSLRYEHRKVQVEIEELNTSAQNTQQ